MRNAALIAFLLVAGFALGCQEGGRAATTSSPTVPMADSHDDDVYTRDNLNENDEERPRNFALRAMDSTDAAVSSFFSGITHRVIKTYKYLRGERPSNYARMMEDPESPDHRREGINGLLEYDFTKKDPYTKRYRQIGQFDPDATARATAVRASNRCRDARATTVFVRALTDKSELVRLEGAKGLVHQPDPAAVAPLLTVAAGREENHDVRIAAIDALKHYRQPAVARALIAALNDRDFAIAWQSRRSLRYLTARDYRYDDGAWLAYFTGPERPF